MSLLQDYSRGGSQATFAVVFMARSGSNLLCSLLDSHRDVICHHEVFGHARPHLAICARGQGQGFKDEILAEGTKGEAQLLHCLTDLTRFRSVPGKHTARAIGFKVSPTVNARVAVPLLLNRSVRKVLLYRRDLLASFVSLQRAERGGSWIQLASSDGDDPGAARIPMHLDRGKFRRFVRKRRLVERSCRAVLSSTRQRFLPVAYEDLFKPPVQRSILEFLDAESSEPLEAGTRKQNAATLLDAVANADELLAECARLGVAAAALDGGVKS